MLTPTLQRISATAKTYVSPTPLQSPQEIHQLLSTVTWSLQDLRTTFSTDPITVTPDYLHKLLNRAGLELPTSDAERNSLIEYLQRQGQMVHHVHNISTEGLRPLGRIAPDQPRKITLQQMKQPEKYSGKNVASWDPLSLAKIKEGRFFVLNEGLKKKN
ncbi:hypothetical protein NADFUDRAFT_44243 [Nadsonia fulvescens var. elongata DSM 6958]|uniref:Glutamyl-tRNA(Gln) amidotransferase subunit F, mitochondrial n=1 Tax=Nadsonia fulvescens var. elongata DSM 6958 TaxID=857566 RepID=A0A1E3PEG3_9ASCO|nr:hypothetical protein NADFUDRAFT_44243 [Nadsonia fulvescens var. elongata DSM 6958]